MPRAAAARLGSAPPRGSVLVHYRRRGRRGRVSARCGGPRVVRGDPHLSCPRAPRRADRAERDRVLLGRPPDRPGPDVFRGRRHLYRGEPGGPGRMGAGHHRQVRLALRRRPNLCRAFRPPRPPRPDPHGRAHRPQPPSLTQPTLRPATLRPLPSPRSPLPAPRPQFPGEPSLDPAPERVPPVTQATPTFPGRARPSSWIVSFVYGR